MNKYKVNVNGTDYEITIELRDANAPAAAPAAAPAPAPSNENQSRRPAQSSNYQKNNNRNYQNAPQKPQQQTNAPMSFEDMMAKFKQESDEKISVLKKSGDFKTGTRRGYNK